MDPNIKEKIEKYAKNDWNFRRRIINDIEYILTYKGRKERSLGPFSQEKWNLLIELGAVRPSHDIVNSKIEILETEMESVKTDVSELFEWKSKRDSVDTSLDWKVANCFYAKTYMGKNTFCSRFFWDRKPYKIVKRFPNLTFKKSAMDFDGKNRKWRFIPHPDICGLCSPIDNLFSKFNENLFKDINKLKEDYHGVEKILSMGLYERFKCEKCDARHLIAIKYKCTNCDSEGWWGYWPS